MLDVGGGLEGLINDSGCRIGSVTAVVLLEAVDSGVEEGGGWPRG